MSRKGGQLHDTVLPEAVNKSEEVERVRTNSERGHVYGEKTRRRLNKKLMKKRKGSTKRLLIVPNENEPPASS